MSWTASMETPRKFFEDFKKENPEFFEDDNDG